VTSNLSPDVEHTLADAEENVRAVAQLAADRRVPLYVDSTIPAVLAPEARKYYVSAESARHVTAVAVVADSVLGRIVANLTIPRLKQPVPMKLFANEAEALAWLREALQR
jgi:hypothetical protein